MSFRPQFHESEIVKANIVSDSPNGALNVSVAPQTTAAAAVARALFAVYEATPAVAEFVEVAAVVAILATPQQEAKLTETSKLAFNADVVKLKSYQLDKR